VAIAMMPFEFGCEGIASAQTLQQRVIEGVRRITAEQMGLPLEKVLPESDFVKDLGID
jgi:hypothetical protein